MKKLLSIFLITLAITGTCWGMKRKRSPQKQKKLDKNLIHILKAKIDNTDYIRHLLEQSANPNCEIEGETPLMAAISNQNMVSGKTVKVIKLLLDNNANPNIKNQQGETPLTKAINILGSLLDVPSSDKLYEKIDNEFEKIEKDHYEIIKLLLQHGANPNEKTIYQTDRPQESPLQITLKNSCSTNIYTLLLSFHAKIKKDILEDIIKLTYSDIRTILTYKNMAAQIHLISYHLWKTARTNNIVKKALIDRWKSTTITEDVINNNFLTFLKAIIQKHSEKLNKNRKKYKHRKLYQRSHKTRSEKIKTALKKIEELEEKEHETKKEQIERFIFPVKKANNKVIPKIQVKLMYNNNPLLAEMPKIFLCL